MKATNNKISIEVLDLHYETVPVMRNGKPTKKTKEVLVYGSKEVTASGYIVEGHEVFIVDEALEAVKNGTAHAETVMLYKKDGSAVIAVCKFGRTGQADHRTAVMFNVKNESIHISSTGYNGPTMHGWGASVKRIEWD